MHGIYPPREPSPFCQCFIPPSASIVNDCRCGEEIDIIEWKWQNPGESSSKFLELSRENTQTTFNLLDSSGTAVARGDTSLNSDLIHYWEIKVLTEPCGTDLMIGVKTGGPIIEDNKAHPTLEHDDSYGLSNTGTVSHNGELVHSSLGFGAQTIVGVKVNMWAGSLEFFLNREGLGVSFRNLRKYPVLYPMICSNGTRAVLRLIYASSWKSSLLTDAAVILANSTSRNSYVNLLPSRLKSTFENQFYLTLPRRQNDEESIEDRRSGTSSNLTA